MEFTLHTYDIQDLIIALIIRDRDYLDEQAHDRGEKLGALLIDLNNLCNPANDFTIKLKVEE